MKILIFIFLVSLHLKASAQDYIEWGTYNCGKIDATYKTVLLRNGKSFKCTFKYNDRISLRDSCTTDFIVTRLLKDSTLKSTEETLKQLSEIFKYAQKLAILPTTLFQHESYCEVVYKISISNHKQEFSSRSGKTRQQKDSIKKIIRLIGQLNQKE
jgi:uncharacterized lipoprotein YehR (DUF1307 family)